MTAPIDRRSVVGGLAAGAMLAPRGARAALPPLPKAPVALSIIDVGGALALLQAGFDAYNMSGGLLEWAADGLPMEPSDGYVAEA